MSNSNENTEHEQNSGDSAEAHLMLDNDSMHSRMIQRMIPSLFRPYVNTVVRPGLQRVRLGFRNRPRRRNSHGQQILSNESSPDEPSTVNPIPGTSSEPNPIPGPSSKPNERLAESVNTVININSNSNTEEDDDDDSSSSSSELNQSSENNLDTTNDGETENNNPDETPPDGETNEENNQEPTSISETVSDALNQMPELRNSLLVNWHHFVLVIALLAKTIFDQISGLLVILIFFFMFTYSNMVVRRNVAVQGKKQIVVPLLCIITIPFMIYKFYEIYWDEKYHYSLIFLPPIKDKLFFTDLLWLVIVTDFIIKLFTVIIKAVIVLIPGSLLVYCNRGKYFLLIERCSQLYRSITPIQAWMSYLLDSYLDFSKVFGIFISGLYCLSKGPELINGWKAFEESVHKFIQSVEYGIVPSPADLEDAGGTCPICHDNYLLPIMLKCKHIFCKQCVITWFDRERTCPLCRTQVAENPAWKNGETSSLVQLY